jgi:hypothetical protein
VVDRFYVVSVGVEHVGAVVACVVLGPQPWRAVIAPVRLQRRGVEAVHGLPAGSGEGDVEPGDGPLTRVDEKPPTLPAAEGQEALVLELQAEAPEDPASIRQPNNPP